jgi:hypothetical protein
MKSLSLLLTIVALVVCCISSSVNAFVPNISSQFIVNNRQIDDTEGKIVLEQLLVFDPINRRSKMTAQGSLVSGFLEQVVRCDGPQSPIGYMLQLSGASVQTAGCLNQTINEEWSNFWSFPANASYIGKDIVPNTTFEYPCWMYWQDSEQYKVYVDIRRSPSTGEKEHIPIWSGKVWTNKPGYHLYHDEWLNFKAGPPPLSAFVPEGDVSHCQNMPPALHNDKSTKKEKRGINKYYSSFKH